MARDDLAPERPAARRPGARVACVVSTFHAELTGAMARSAFDELTENGGLDREDVRTVRVPGAFELPLVARRLARRDDVDAVLCLGIVLTGETTHDRWVAQGAQQGIVQASLETDTPILFGVLTCQSLEQARARALPGAGHDKGREVARAALETLAALDEAATLRFGAEGAAQ